MFFPKCIEGFLLGYLLDAFFGFFPWFTHWLFQDFLRYSLHYSFRYSFVIISPDIPTLFYLWISFQDSYRDYSRILSRDSFRNPWKIFILTSVEIFRDSFWYSSQDSLIESFLDFHLVFFRDSSRFSFKDPSSYWIKMFELEKKKMKA